VSGQDDSDDQGKEREDDSSRTLPNDPVDEAQLGNEEGDYTAKNIGERIKAFLSRLKLTDWITAIGTAVIAAATIVNVVIVADQLGEMHNGGIDTHNLAVATGHLADESQIQASAMDKLRKAGESQAAAMDKLRVAGEAQARAMDRLKSAGEAQALAAKKLADAGRAQAISTRNLAENSGRQFSAIQASADAAKVQASAVREQAQASITASKATDRLAQAGQAQAAAVAQSLDVARAANDIASRASLAADRPWVSISMPGDVEPTAGQDYKVEVNVTNVGRSPALNAMARIEIVIIDAAKNFENLEKCSGICPTYTVFPTSGGFQVATIAYHPTLLAAVLTPEAIKSITDRKTAILLRLRVDYQDTSGNSHMTASCYNLVPKFGFTTCNGGNQAN
jgi:hypothetical protein